MLIRKSLYGNLHPNPGDLYDPRDGSCLPNFHLSTTHNPNLAHMVQEMVRYDIQLVPEAPNSLPQHSNTNLTLLAVAEYSERIDVMKQRIFPFTIHRVFYREAIAGVLMLQRAISDKEISLLKNVLSNCIPNPENMEGRLFEQCVRPINKVSIIQHGQEYHYTNIKMAFAEVSKIVNFVCSPDNLNARSVLVDIPSVIDYTLLDENKHLAYMHEQGRRRKQKQSKMHDQRTDEGRYSSLDSRRGFDQHWQSHKEYHNTWHREQKSDTPVWHRGLQQENSLGDNVDSAGPYHYRNLQIETRIRTENGKKIVSYAKTGQQIVYNEEDIIRGYGYGVLLEDLDNKSKKPLSKSLTNLAGDLGDKSRGQSSDEQYPLTSYLRNRSQSLEDILDTDKIDRYPSLLIEPGRRKPKKAPETTFNIKNTSFESAYSDDKTSANANNLGSKNRYSFNGGQSLELSNFKVSASRNPSLSGMNNTTGRFRKEEEDDRISVVSTFSDISVSTIQRNKADDDFEEYLRKQEGRGNHVTASQAQTHTGRRIVPVKNNRPLVHRPQQRTEPNGLHVRQNILVPRHPANNRQIHHHSSAQYHDDKYKPQVITEPEDNMPDSNPRKNFLQPVSLHPNHLKAAEDFLSKHYDSYYAVSLPTSSTSDSSPTYSRAGHNNSALTLESPPSSPTPSGGETLDRSFIYRAFPANVH